MAEQIPITVVIPCFCCENMIKRAVDSVAQQTKKPAEVILVDDASSDSTLEVLHKIANQHLGWVKVIGLINNQGAANARNVGWNNASQPYIAFLDADDAWHPKKLEIQYQFMQANPQVVLCGHDAKIVFENIQPDWPLCEYEFKYISKNKLLISNPFVTPSVIVRKDITPRFDPTKRYVDDHLLWMQIAFDGGIVARLNLALVAIYKPMFGASGLSSHLWAMEKSEFDNYWILYKSKKIGFITVNILSVYSLVKYLRRLVIVSLRRVRFVKD